jgi:hypothetical protein
MLNMLKESRIEIWPGLETGQCHYFVSKDKSSKKRADVKTNKYVFCSIEDSLVTPMSTQESIGCADVETNLPMSQGTSGRETCLHNLS